MVEFDIIRQLVTAIACLNRHAFFKDKDMDEWMPFISKLLYDNGIYAMPVGCAWCIEVSKDMVEKYLDEYKELFEEHRKWVISQR